MTEKEIKQIKIKWFIETINEINLDECEIKELKRILLAKWFIKNFKLTDYIVDFQINGIDDYSEKYTKEFIRKKLILNNENYSNISFMYKGYEIYLGLNKESDVVFYNKELQKSIIDNDLVKFLYYSELENQEKISELLNGINENLDKLIVEIMKKEITVKLREKKKELFKNNMKNFIKEKL